MTRGVHQRNSLRQKGRNISSIAWPHTLESPKSHKPWRNSDSRVSRYKLNKKNWSNLYLYQKFCFAAPVRLGGGGGSILVETVIYICIHTNKNICAWRLYIYNQTYIYIYICVYMYVHIWMYIYACWYVHIHIYSYVCMYIRICFDVFCCFWKKLRPLLFYNTSESHDVRYFSDRNQK